MQFRTIFSAITVAFVAVTPALADGFYYGVGIGANNAESNTGPGSPYIADATFATLGGTAGYRWDRPDHFMGAEATINLGLGAEFSNGAVGCEVGASGPYYCSHDATIRLRGLIGTDIGNDFELFGALGLGVIIGDGATSPTARDRGVNTGVTAGIGVQKQAGANTHRIELIYDNLTNNSTQPGGTFSPEYRAVSLNYTLIFGR